jgi:hypothetical protein
MPHWPAYELNEGTQGTGLNRVRVAQGWAPENWDDGVNGIIIQ